MRASGNRATGLPVPSLYQGTTRSQPPVAASTKEPGPLFPSTPAPAPVRPPAGWPLGSVCRVTVLASLALSATWITLHSPSRDCSPAGPCTSLEVSFLPILPDHRKVLGSPEAPSHKHCSALGKMTVLVERPSVPKPRQTAACSPGLPELHWALLIL